MKKMMLGLCLLLPTLAFAEGYPYPQVFNWGHSAQIQIYNHTPRQITCSGMVYLHTTTGTDSFHYYEWIYPHAYSYRHFYPNGVGERINFVNHFINCY